MIDSDSLLIKLLANFSHKRDAKYGCVKPQGLVLKVGQIPGTRPVMNILSVPPTR